MKKELNCSIVQDLLPNYIEELTSDDTNHMIEAHMDTCEDCKKAHEQMAAEISNPEKIPVIELKFLKKVNRTRLLAAGLCVFLTLALSYLIYSSEYKYTDDKNDLAVAVNEYITPFYSTVEAYILETKDVNGTLVVSFKDQSANGGNGIAVLLKGINQKYRIVQAQMEPSNYSSSIVQFFPVEINDEQYFAVSAYNLSNEIKYYGLDYAAYKNPGYFSKDRVRKFIKFEVKNQQFLDIYHSEELDSILEQFAEENLYNYHIVSTAMFDANGMEITDKFTLSQEELNSQDEFGNIYKAELFMLYVFIAMVMGLGFILTRYFLTE
ncbi:MAG: zf-HC2 domain-containing protein [Peptostreptococcaceae bacterium]|nr:zf-HC2 domain-containing protein [Peptostreptococcaceae bacterium]